MKRTFIVLALLAGTGLEGRIPQQPGIQHKIPDGCFNPMWDEDNEVWICESFGGSDGFFSGTQICSRCNSVWAYIYLTLGVKQANEYDNNSAFLRVVAECTLNAPPEQQNAYNGAVDIVCQSIANGRGCVQ